MAEDLSAGTFFTALSANRFIGHLLSPVFATTAGRTVGVPARAAGLCPRLSSELRIALSILSVSFRLSVVAIQRAEKTREGRRT